MKSNLPDGQKVERLYLCKLHLSETDRFADIQYKSAMLLLSWKESKVTDGKKVESKKKRKKDDDDTGVKVIPKTFCLGGFKFLVACSPKVASDSKRNFFIIASIFGLFNPFSPVALSLSHSLIFCCHLKFHSGQLPLKETAVKRKNDVECTSKSNYMFELPVSSSVRKVCKCIFH